MTAVARLERTLNRYPYRDPLPVLHTDLRELVDAAKRAERLREVIQHVLSHGQVGKQSERRLREALLPTVEEVQAIFRRPEVRAHFAGGPAGEQ